MKMTLIALAALAALGFAQPGGAADPNFAQQALKDGQMEVALSQLALQKSQNAAVKQYAQMLVTDHSAANQKLAAMTSGARTPPATGTPPRTAPAPGNAAASPDYKKLQRLSGAAFDKAYADTMIADHQKAIALFEKEAKEGSGATKQFAAETLPKLKMHLQHAQDMQVKIK